MPDYQKGKIYCIRSHQTDKVYVGSTVQTLSLRMGAHKRNLKKYKNGKYHYVTSFDILEYDDAYIELIEDFACDNKSQLEKREGHFIREMDCVNKVVAGRTVKEFQEENKDFVKQRQKKYREVHVDKMKEWKAKNRELINKLQNEYYNRNKDRINEERRIKKKQESNSI